jgi:hypothetical protein
MGIAAYNRGSAAIRRHLAENDRPHEFYVLDRLNTLPRGSKRPFQATVVRSDNDGQWWLMNRQQGGWSEFGYPYPSLRELCADWSIMFVGLGCDEHSFFYQVEPV